MGPDTKVSIDGSASYSGYISIQQTSSGRYYAEVFAQVGQDNPGTEYEPYGKIQSFQDGNLFGSDQMDKMTDLSNHVSLQRGDMKTVGFGRVYLPNTGKATVKIVIGNSIGGRNPVLFTQVYPLN